MVRLKRCGLVAAVVLIVSLLAPVPGAAQTPGSFSTQPGPGATIATYSGGPVEGIEAAAPNAQTFFVAVGGSFLAYVAGAPDFVNAEFVEHFGGVVPPDTGMLIISPSAPPPTTFAPGYFEIGRTLVNPRTTEHPDQAVVEVINLSDETIVSFELTICPFNAFGEPASFGGQTCFTAIYNTDPIAPDGSVGAVWSLEDWGAVSMFTAKKLRSVTDTGTIWIAP